MASWRNSAVIRSRICSDNGLVGRTTFVVASRNFGDRPEGSLLRLQLLAFQSFCIAAIGKDGSHRLTIDGLSDTRVDLSSEAPSGGEIP